MASIDEAQLREALLKRKGHILANVETITAKQVRRLLEGDLNLETKALDVHKAAVDKFLHEDLFPAAATHVEAPQPAAASPKAKVKAHKAQQPASASPDFVVKAPKAKKVKKADEGGMGGEGGGRKRKAADEKAAGAKAKKSKSKHGAVEQEADDEEEGAGSASSGDDERQRKPQAPPRPAAKQHGARVEKLKAICRGATIRVPPRVYQKSKDDRDLEAALKDILAEHGLSGSSSSHEIERVRRSLELKRDLDGIDMGNIITEADTRRPRRAAAAAAKRYKADSPAIEESEEEDEDDHADKENGGGGGSAGARAAGRGKASAGGGRQGKKRRRIGDSEDDSDEDFTVDSDDD